MRVMNHDRAGNQVLASVVNTLLRRCGYGVLAVLLSGHVFWINAAVTGTISGFVRDPSGAAVPGVNVTAKMVEQQISRTVQTNSEGYYTLVAMPAGTYEITFEITGFQKQVRSGVPLTVNENIRVDISLVLGAVKTEVSVVGA